MYILLGENEINNKKDDKHSIKRIFWLYWSKPAFFIPGANILVLI